MAAKKNKNETPLMAHARKELTLLGEEDYIIDQYMKVVKAFSEMSHTGASASIAIPVINSLLLFKHLTPLTDDPEEWTDVGKEHGLNTPLWQNKRNSEAFSTDNGRTYYLISEGAHMHNQRPLHDTMRKEQ